MIFVQRFILPPPTSFFLFGPRGTGKSLWVKNTFENALYIDLLDPEYFRVYTAYPERLKELLNAQLQKKDIIIDEIQKVPYLLPLVHSLIEEKKGYRFILTGSSSRKLKRSGVDLLAGRALHYTMHPFLPSELGEHFIFEKALQYGLVPLVYFSQSPEQTLASYVSLYLKEEIQAEALIRNIPAFTRFLEALSFSHASVLNVSQVARECMVERKTVEGYLKVLEDLLLCFTINIFSKRAKRKLISHSKFYFFDTGVFRHLRPKGPLDRLSEIDGQALEGLVAQTLRVWMHYRNKNNTLYYWRTINGLEVDFIVYGEDGLYAIEVKNARNIYHVDLKGLEAFKKDYPEAQCTLLYRGVERLQKGDVVCIPVEEFLYKLHPDRPIMDIQ